MKQQLKHQSSQAFRTETYRLLMRKKTRFTLFVDMVCYLSQFDNAIVDLLHCYWL